MNRNIAKTVYKISDFLSWQRSRSLVLSPSFQRRSVWPQAAKSLLIDTIVRGLPMPIIFLRERTDLSTFEPIREVVDGQQRIRTVLAFIEPRILKDFDKGKDSFVVKRTHNKEISGKTFRQLSSEVQKRILNYDFSVHVLPSETEDREVLQIFARMNSSGVKLNRQELRNAEYYGVFKKLSYTLAYEQLNRWREWKVFSETEIARMIEVEETSELIRLMLLGVQGGSQSALDNLYKNHEESFAYESEVSRRFRIVMDKIDDTLGAQMQTLAFSRKVLFHTLFTFYYDFVFGLESPLKKVKAENLPLRIVKSVRLASDKIILGELPEKLEKVFRGATRNKGIRLSRLKFLQDTFKNV